MRAVTDGHGEGDSQWQQNLHIFPIFSEGGWEQWGKDMESDVDLSAKKKKTKKENKNIK